MTVPQNITYILKATAPPLYSKPYSWCLEMINLVLSFTHIFDMYCNSKTPLLTSSPTVLLHIIERRGDKVFVLDPGECNPLSVLCHANKPSANDSNIHPSILGVSWGYYPVSDFVIIFANVTRSHVHQTNYWWLFKAPRLESLYHGHGTRDYILWSHAIHM